MTPGQCAAARRILDWSARELARRANTSSATIIRFERGETETPNRAVLDNVRRAFDAAGVTFDHPSRPATNTVARVEVVKLEDGSSIYFSRS